MRHPLSKPSPAPAQTPSLDPHLYADALAYGAPQDVQAHLQEHDRFVLVQAERRIHCYTTAALGSLLALNFAPELVRASTYCLSTVSAEASAGCRANGVAALGALCGLGAAAAASYALYRETNAVGEFAARKDAELQHHHAAALQADVDDDQDDHLISRYSALPLAQRKRLQRELTERK